MTRIITFSNYVIPEMLGLPSTISPHDFKIPLVNNRSSPKVQPVLLLDSNYCNAIHSTVANGKFARLKFEEILLIIRKGFDLQPSLYAVEHSSKYAKDTFFANTARTFRSLAIFDLSIKIYHEKQLSITTEQDLRELLTLPPEEKIKSTVEKFIRYGELKFDILDVFYAYLLMAIIARKPSDPIKSIERFAELKNKSGLPDSAMGILVAFLFFVNLITDFFGYNKNIRNNRGIEKIYASAVDLFLLSLSADFVNLQSDEFCHPVGICTLEKRLKVILDHVELIEVHNGVPIYEFREKTIDQFPVIAQMYERFISLNQRYRPGWNLKTIIEELEAQVR